MLCGDLEGCDVGEGVRSEGSAGGRRIHISLKVRIFEESTIPRILQIL